MIGTLGARLTIGALFVGHGTQKLFGWFGGHGVEGTGGFFESSLGLAPGKRHAIAAGVSESRGGTLLTHGAVTPGAAAPVTGTMVNPKRKAPKANGPWVSDGGYEYNLVLIAAMTALADTGPGKPSVDAARMPWLKGPAFALMALAAGVAGSYLATEVFNEAPAAPAAQEGASEVPGDPAAADEASHTDTGRFTQPADSPADLGSVTETSS
jgi:putative oxidoreductase